MHRDDVMTPEHPRWDVFIDELAHSLICFENTQNARRVLESMTGIDVDASLEAMRRLQGRCDCEIVFALGEAQRTPA